MATQFQSKEPAVAQLTPVDVYQLAKQCGGVRWNDSMGDKESLFIAHVQLGKSKPPISFAFRPTQDLSAKQFCSELSLNSRGYVAVTLESPRAAEVNPGFMSLNHPDQSLARPLVLPSRK